MESYETPAEKPVPGRRTSVAKPDICQSSQNLLGDGVRIIRPIIPDSATCESRIPTKYLATQIAIQQKQAIAAQLSVNDQRVGSSAAQTQTVHAYFDEVMKTERKNDLSSQAFTGNTSKFETTAECITKFEKEPFRRDNKREQSTCRVCTETLTSDFSAKEKAIADQRELLQSKVNSSTDENAKLVKQEKEEATAETTSKFENAPENIAKLKIFLDNTIIAMLL